MGCGRAAGWALFRVLRCGPGGTHGIDNVPEALDAALSLVSALALLGDRRSSATRSANG